MKFIKKLFNSIPGLLIMILILGVLHVFNLKTETLGQVQRLLLATGIRNANVPDLSAATGVAAPAETVHNDFQMIDLKGAKVPFDSLKGKVIFLNIWATWCPPCVAEMPNIQNLYEKVGSDQIAFVMLSIDEDGLEKVKKFIDRKGYTFPVYLLTSPLPEEFNSPAIPTTYIISPEGKIISKHEGMAKYDTPEVQGLLKGLAITGK